MITESDAMNTIDLGDYYAILPSVLMQHTKQDFISHYKAKMFLLVLNMIQAIQSGKQSKIYEI